MRRLPWLCTAALASLALTLGACSDDGGSDEASTTNTEDSAGDGDGDNTGDGDGDPEPGECLDPDPEVSFSYGFGGFSALADPAPNVEWTCSIRQLDTSNGLSVELDCDGAPEFIVVTVTATPSFTSALTGNETINLRYVSWTVGMVDYNYLRLDVAGGGNVLTLIDGEEITPGAEHGFDHFVPITPDGGWCTPVSYFCGTRDRVAATFAMDGTTYAVLDGQHGLIGAPPGIDVWVEEAYVNVINPELDCGDEPVGKARILVVNQAQE